MLKLLGGVKQFLKIQEITIDSTIFRLHNIFTTVFLLSCSLIITATQYVGNPINCIVNGLPAQPVNTYCWIMSTFTMPDAFQRQVGTEVAHPGVANDFGDEDAKKYYSYYQWVCFVLFFQGIMCYIPKLIWETAEGGLMETLVMGLNVGICDKDEKCFKKKIIIDYLVKNIKIHSSYVVKYFACEFLCFFNVIIQIYGMNKFFDGEFLSYGLDVLKFSEQNQEDRVDPMVYVFPRVTKCTFYKYGPSGSIQTHDSLCILPLNIVNEKTYIFIWFWFLILFILVGLLVLYRLGLIFFPKLRPIIMRSKNRQVSRTLAEALCRKTSLSDWWILYMLERNIDPLVYRDIAAELAKKLDINSKMNM